VKSKLILILFLAAVIFPIAAQDAATAALIAERKETEERFRKLEATVEQMTEAYTLQQKRLNSIVDELNKTREENSRLREEITRSTAHGTEQVRKLAEKLQEIETLREADKKLILEEVRKMARVSAAAPPAERKPELSTQKTGDASEEYYPHIVKEGQILSAILSAYNEQFKKEGKRTISMAQLLKANPKINPNTIHKGQEILIPVPPAK